MIIMFIMAGVVVTTGYVSLSQASLQAQVQDVKTINQRLDATVRAVEASFRKYPGMSDVGPYGAEFDTDGMPILPVAMGVVRETPWGSKFRYCPLAPIDNRGVLTGFETQTIAGSGGSSDIYTVTNYKNTVVYDNSTAFAAAKAMSGVAIITAASKQGQQAPSCNNVVFNQSDITVPGGLARLVYLPRRTFMPNSSEKKVTSYYVSQNGSGDLSGDDAENTSQINAAIYDVLNKKPRETYFTLVGTVTPAKQAWVDLTNITAWSRKISIEGGELVLPAIVETNPSGRTWIVYGDWQLTNTNIYNARATVRAGSTLGISGNVDWNAPDDTDFGSSIVTNNGSRLNIINANLNFKITKEVGAPVINVGTATIRNSVLNIANVTGARYWYTILNYFKIEMDNSHIGGPPTGTGWRALHDGLGSVSPPAHLIMHNQNTITANVNGRCWGDYDNASVSRVARANEPGATFTIPPESEFAESSQTNDLNTPNYRADAERRRVSRSHATGSLRCV